MPPSKLRLASRHTPHTLADRHTPRQQQKLHTYTYTPPNTTKHHQTPLNTTKHHHATIQTTTRYMITPIHTPGGECPLKNIQKNIFNILQNKFNLIIICLFQIQLSCCWILVRFVINQPHTIYLKAFIPNLKFFHCEMRSSIQ